MDNASAVGYTSPMIKPYIYPIRYTIELNKQKKQKNPLQTTLCASAHPSLSSLSSIDETYSQAI